MSVLHPLTVEEYLELEESSTVKHEYVGGEIHAMTGGSYVTTRSRARFIEGSQTRRRGLLAAYT
jgi:Uma2 family endonuclease